MWAEEQAVRYFVGVVHGTLAVQPNTSEKKVRGQGKCIRVIKAGDVLPLILFVLLSHEQLLRVEETAVKVFGRRRCIYSSTNREREVNSCWRRSGAVLVAASCQ